MAGGAGEIGGVADDQDRARDVCRIGEAIGAAFVIAPLREPRAQRGEAAKADRAIVDNARIAQIAGVRRAV